MTTPMRTGSEPESHLLRREMYEALWPVDTSALNGFMDADVLRWITSTDIPPLWDLCWQVWQRSPPAEYPVLGTFIALMKAWYPWLQIPQWATDVEPEAL